MINDEESRECVLDECKDLDGKYKEEKKCCVCINIYAECDKNYPFVKKPCKDSKKKEKDCCVCINIFPKCEE